MRLQSIEEQFNEVVKESGLNYGLNQSISGYYRLVIYNDDNSCELIHDDPACEDVYDKESAMALFAEIIREKGTNRSRFFRGQVDKYTWVSEGSSYLPSELNAAYLWAQLEESKKIFDNRMTAWQCYYENLERNLGLCKNDNFCCGSCSGGK